jgi:hypothetical protein
VTAARIGIRPRALTVRVPGYPSVDKARPDDALAP